MEEIMTTFNLGPSLKYHRTLDDAELNTVTGGSLSLAYEEIRFEYTEQGTTSPALPAKHWFNGG
jgi:hypothetical protein